jgi:sarcosine oxidase, subunit beta
MSQPHKGMQMPDAQALIDEQIILELLASADVVVIGGGIVGAATALWLTRAGRAPVILERENGLATVTTSSSAHCICDQFSDPENIAMMSESLGYFERFAELLDVAPEIGSISLQQQGYLFAKTEPEERRDFEHRVSGSPAEAAC